MGLIALVMCLSSFKGMAQENNQYSKLYNQEKFTTSEQFVSNGYTFARMVLRHGGNDNCKCPNCKCPGCKCPIGVCFCSGTQPTTPTKAPGFEDDSEEGGNIGYAWAKIVDEELHLIFLSNNKDEDGNTPITEQYVQEKENLDAVGSSRPFLLYGGVFKLNFEKYDFGEIVLKIKLD